MGGVGGSSRKVGGQFLELLESDLRTFAGVKVEINDLETGGGDD